MSEQPTRFSPRERAVLVLLALYVGVVLVVLTPIGGAFGQGAAPGELPAAPIDDTVSGSDPTVGRPIVGGSTDLALTLTQQDRARELVAADSSLTAAVGGTPYTIVKSGPWTTSGADGVAPRVLGAAYVLNLSAPVALDAAALPGVLYDQSEQRDPPYQSVVNTVSSSRVTQLLVLVDLARGKVVNVTPGLDSQNVESAAPAGFQRTVPAPQEGSTP